MTNARKPSADARTNDADATRSNILDVAMCEFADKGLDGARIDEIAEKTNSSKRMIYYYFGGKDELYRAVLERAYASIRDQESEANFEALPADKALAAHIEHTFDYHTAHPEFVRLVMNENIHRAEHLKHVAGIKDRNARVIAQLTQIIDKGIAARQFRKGVNPLDLHISISALCFYNVSNRHTIAANFDHDMGVEPALSVRRAQVVEIVLRSILA